MYDHPGCVFTDLAAVRRYLDGRDIEIVPGGIAATCGRREGEDLVLTFIDADNYTRPGRRWRWRESAPCRAARSRARGEDVVQVSELTSGPRGRGQLAAA